MNEIKFVKFGSLEGKKCIEKKFPGITDSDLVYVECGDTYIVIAIDNEGVEFVSTFDMYESGCGIDEEIKNALDNAPKDFTIYVPAPAKKEVAEEKTEEKKPVDDNLEEIEVIRKCGHKETVKIEKTSDKEYRAMLIKREQNKLCRSCWEAETKEKTKEAKKSAKKAGLPALKGSAKQKKWAEIIRAEKLDMLRSDPAAGAVTAWYAKNYTKASEWIDVRFMSEFELKRNMEQLKRNMEMKLRFKK